MKSKCIILVCLSLVLSACASKHLESNYRQVLPAVRQTQLTAMSVWKIKGAFSLQQPGQSVVANYQWAQQGSRYDLHIASPLNLFSIKIIGEPDQVKLWRSATAVAEADNPEALMQQQLGWQLPLSNLDYWIRSLPAPGPYRAEYDDYGHLLKLEQAGWVIHYANYVSLGYNDLPTLLKLKNADWDAKILVKQWAF